MLVPRFGDFPDQKLQCFLQICGRGSGKTANICADSSLETSLENVITYWKVFVFDEIHFLFLRSEIYRLRISKLAIDHKICTNLGIERPKMSFIKK